jgi:hypothetical protein
MEQEQMGRDVKQTCIVKGIFSIQIRYCLTMTISCQNHKWQQIANITQLLWGLGWHSG